MVVAILVSFVVLLLSIFVISLSIHNSTQSAYDRKRVQSIDAAEAGLDSFWLLVQTTAPQSLPCASPATGTVASSPGVASYSVQPTYYNSSGGVMSCSLAQASPPSAISVTSTGTTDGGVPRKLQSYAVLTPTNSGTAGAIVMNSGATFNNSFTVNGNNGNNADIYVNQGDLTILNQPDVFGNIYVSNGNFSASNNSTVHGNVWANGTVTINSPAAVTSDVTSSTTSISGTGTVGGNATAGSTIASTLSVAGTKLQSSPQGPPPSQPIPYVCWTAIAGVCTAQSADWTAAGYTIHTDTTCSSALTYLTTGTITGNVVERIAAVCDLSVGNNATVNFNGNLAIFTDGSITMSNLNTWTEQGSTGNLFFLANYRTGLNCATGSYDISTGNHSIFNNANVAFYSPCNVTINNLNDFSGQVVGQTVNIANNFTLTFQPVVIPGAGTISGFKQDIQYVREIA